MSGRRSVLLPMTPGDNPSASFRANLIALKSAQKKAAPGAPPYSVYVNRRIGRYFAAAAHQVRMTPNMVTAVSAFFTFGGILLLALGSPSGLIGVAIWALLAVGYALDSADGQLARLRGGGSVAGEWLDHVIDSAKISSVHLAVLITAFTHFGLASPSLFLLVPVGFSVVAAVSFFAMILNDHLKVIVAFKSGRNLTSESSSSSLVKSLLLIPTDYGVLCLLFVFVGAPGVFFSLYTLFFLANAGHLLLASIKWFTDMKQLATPDIETSSRDEL